MSGAMKRFYASGGKRVLDCGCSAFLLVATSPLHAACALSIWIKDGRPIYFSQLRAGRSGVPFKLHKLRTMRVGTESSSGNYPAPDMVTTTGKLLRRTSLDEMPQLLNILLGHMSLVGPRPALLTQVARYNSAQRGRLSVRPGLTGLAQVRYRNAARWSVRIESDLEYIRELSFTHDALLVLKTAKTVFRGAGQVVGQSLGDVDDLGPGLAGHIAGDDD